MKTVFIALLLISTSGLASSKKDILSSMPLSKMFWSLYLEKTIIGQYDCSNKCGKYVRALTKAGYQADITVIRPHKSRFLHAIVRLYGKNGIKYLDPTRGTTSDDLGSLGQLIEIIAIDHLEEKGKEYK